MSVTCLLADPQRADSPEPWPLAVFYGDGGQARSRPDLGLIPEAGAWDRTIAAIMYVLLRERRVRHFGGGVAFYVSGIPEGAVDLEQTVSVQAAALLAAAHLLGSALPPDEAARLCREAQWLVPGVPAGPAAALSVMHAESNGLVQVRGGALSAETLRPPMGVTLSAISSGVHRPDALRKYREAHVAAEMGRRMILSILPHGEGAAGWDGLLGRLGIAEYVERLRDRLPTKLKGAAFLDRFGPLPATDVPVVPDAVYKVRSRTEHYIYESTRAQQFVERLARTVRTGERGALLAAGELMYASHWSYGQRCGLGSLETDRIVNLLRRRGADHGIFGAKVSGCCGGAVAVLAADTADTRAVLHEVVAEYEAQTGLHAQVRGGSSDGALASGIQEA